MRRFRIWSTRIALGVGLLLLAVSVATITPVDHQPFIRQPFHQSTLSRLNPALPEPSHLPSSVRAGFSRVRLTPELDAPADLPSEGRFRSVPLAGYGARSGRPATGVHDDVWVKAVALEAGSQRVVWVALDALIVPREVADAAAEQLSTDPGLAREQLYLGATHTHSSLGGWGEGVVAEAFAGGFVPGIRSWMTDRIVAAARLAVSNLAPASVGSGSFQAPSHIRNRLVQEAGRVDSEFSLLKFNRPDGSNAVIGAFGAHATVLGASNMDFSADYPGAWARYIEETTGSLALFIAGGVGSHSARTESGTPMEKVARLGRQLGNETLQALDQIQTRSNVHLAIVGLPVDLPETHLRVTDDLRLRPWLSRQILPVQPDTFLQAVRIDDTVWVSTPCDFSGELALVLKDHACTLGRRLTLTSFNGDYIGYVIPARYYNLGGYEPRTMSFFGPAVPDYFDELIRRMLDGL